MIDENDNEGYQHWPYTIMAQHELTTSVEPGRHCLSCP